MLKSNFFLSFVLLFTLSLNAKEINIDKRLQNLPTTKELIIYLHRTGCSYCNSMEEFTLEDETVNDFLNTHYEVIRINITDDDKIIYKNKESSGLEFAKSVGYNFYPSVLFLNEKADIEYASVGYKDEFEFILILNYVKKGFYKQMNLSEYKRITGFKKNSDDTIVDSRKNAR